MCPWRRRYSRMPALLRLLIHKSVREASGRRLPRPPPSLAARHNGPKRRSAPPKETRHERPQARHKRHGDHHRGLRRLGHRRWGLGLRLGAAGRRRVVAAIATPWQGVNWIDTAAVYGLGHSEEVVGRALERFRPGPAVRLHQVRPGLGPAARTPESGSRRRPLRRECEASLRRLGSSASTCTRSTGPTRRNPVEDSWGEMGRFVDEGKVRAIGVSNYSVELLERCERVRHVDSLQPPFSLIRRGSAADVIPWAAAHGTGVIVYSPMASGILTDSFSPARVAAMARGRLAAQGGHSRAGAVAQPRPARRPAADRARHGTTVSAVAVAWTLAWPGVTGAIVGARARADRRLARRRLADLTAADLAEIAAAVERTGAGTGPVRPAEASPPVVMARPGSPRQG